MNLFSCTFKKKSYPPRGQHFQRSCGRPCWSTQWTNQCRGRSTLNWKNSIKIQFSLLLFYVIYIYFITIGYFILRAQIFKLFLSCCVPYVNFHCLQEKFVFFKVRPPPSKLRYYFDWHSDKYIAFSSKPTFDNSQFFPGPQAPYLLDKYQTP